MNNPFKFGIVVEGKDFCDRIQEMEDIKQTLYSQMSVTLISPRRYGKTSLIYNLFKNIKGRKVVYIDLMGITTLDEFASRYATEIIKSSGGINKFFSNMKKLLPTISKVTFNNMSIEFDFKSSKSDIEEILQLPEKMNKKFIIALDEFQEIKNISKIDLLSILRKKFQFFKNTVFIFSGSKSSIMKNIFSDPKKPFYKFSSIYEVGKLNQDEAVNFIMEKFTLSKIKIDKTLAREVYSLSDGHPYYLQAICHYTWSLARTDKKVDFEKIEKALEKILFMEKYSFEIIWDDLTSNQKLILKSIANGISPYGLNMSPSSVNRAIQSLIKYDLVQKTDHYKISDPLLRKWIKSIN